MKTCWATAYREFGSRGFAFLALFAFAVLAQAQAEDTRRVQWWKPSGYTGDQLFNDLFAPSPGAFCGSIPWGASRACHPRDGGIDYCMPVDMPCNDEWPSVYNDTAISAMPVCTSSLLSGDAPPPKRGFRGRVAFNTTEQRCGCTTSGSFWPPELAPDLTTGYCYDAPSLQYSLSQDRYDARNPDAQIRIEIWIDPRTGPLQHVPLHLRIKSTGVPGELSTTAGLTDDTGSLAVTYTFPDFEHSQIDKVVVTCSVCAVEETSFEIRMGPVLVGFFNGVWNTEKDSQLGLKKIREVSNSVRNSQRVVYDHFYNQSGCNRSGSTCLEDLAEVFIQRQQEIDGVLVDRLEHFWELLSGRYTAPNSLTGSLLGFLGEAGASLAKLLDATFSSMVAQIASGWAQLLSNPPTSTDIATQLAKLQHYADDGSPIVLVGHSQGNLFLNSAHDAFRASHPDVPVHAVHVAPASARLRGDYALADIDLVINALRIQGVATVPAANVGLPFSAVDATGHQLVPTYLDESRAALQRVKAMLASAIHEF